MCRHVDRGIDGRGGTRSLIQRGSVHSYQACSASTCPVVVLSEALETGDMWIAHLAGLDACKHACLRAGRREKKKREVGVDSDAHVHLARGAVEDGFREDGCHASLG